MKKENFHNSKTKKLSLFLAFSLMLSLNSIAQDTAVTGDPHLGEGLFNANCAACHKLDQKLIGPALQDVATKYDRTWLHKWIKNSTEFIKSGDKTAVRIFEENNKIPMTSFLQLSDADIDNILAYTSAKKTAPVAATVVAPPKADDFAPNIVLPLLSVVVAMFTIILLLGIRLLRKVARAKDIDIQEATIPGVYKVFAKNQFLVIATTIILLFASSYFVYAYLMQIGVDQNYQPVQPIHFSHKIHAGNNKINCNYCHSAARVGKTAGIPSLNVCMNCHKSISQVSDTTATAEYSKEFYDAEIQKLYTAVGWDKSTLTYTGKTEPVKWVRIHNLQSFVYFNHSQHVSVAKVECQTCHGPVQTFEIQKQFAPLTMGWCIDCHRKTQVNIKDNDYYTKIHAELSKKLGVDKLTIAQMGGLECGKCHY